MTAPTARNARLRLAAGAALGVVVAVLTGVLWSWDAYATALLAPLTAGVGYYLALCTVLVQTTRAVEEDHLRNVPVGL